MAKRVDEVDEFAASGCHDGAFGCDRAQIGFKMSQLEESIGEDGILTMVVCLNATMPGIEGSRTETRDVPSYQGNNNQTEAQLLKQSRYTKIGVPSKVENSLTLTGQGSAVEDAERDVVALHTT